MPHLLPAAAATDPTTDLVLLKNQRFGPPATAAGHRAELPYRIDALADHGMALRWSDPPSGRQWPGVPDHIRQVAAMAPWLVDAPVVLAMFESSAHPYGLLRTMGSVMRRPGFAVMSCWLPEVLAGASPRRRDRYRRLYATVDVLYHFSANQSDLLCHALELEPNRVRTLRFGVDHEHFRPPTTDEISADAPLLAVGRDRGRDWPTLLDALGRCGAPARILCRPEDLSGATVPPNVTVVGRVDRATYARELRAARAVMVITKVMGYPTGQSVLLEAMASAKACVVTRTPALADYLDDDGAAIEVAPRDPDALAGVLQAIVRDEVDLLSLGRRARAAVERRFTARAMWATVADDLRQLAGGAPLPHPAGGPS